MDKQIGLGGIYFPRLFFLTEEEVASMKVSQLKGYLEEVGLSDKGSKKVLTTRLTEAVKVASFFNVEKAQCIGHNRYNHWAVSVFAAEIRKPLGVGSKDAQFVKNRMLNLFMLKGMTKKAARKETMAWVETYTRQKPRGVRNDTLFWLVANAHYVTSFLEPQVATRPARTTCAS